DLTRSLPPASARASGACVGGPDLVERALPGLLVAAPPQQAGGVAEPLALQLVVRHLDHKLGLQLDPRELTALCPPRRPPGMPPAAPERGALLHQPLELLQTPASLFALERRGVVHERVDGCKLGCADCER